MVMLTLSHSSFFLISGKQVVKPRKEKDKRNTDRMVREWMALRKQKSTLIEFKWYSNIDNAWWRIRIRFFSTKLRLSHSSTRSIHLRRLSYFEFMHNVGRSGSRYVDNDRLTLWMILINWWRCVYTLSNHYCLHFWIEIYILWNPELFLIITVLIIILWSIHSIKKI